MRIKEEYATLKSQDIYSLILFALFKLKDIPEYSALSELIYLFDKDTVLKLCEYFGGLTITFPTIEELELMVYSLVLYQEVDINNIPMEEAVKCLGCKSSDLNKIKQNYKQLIKILENYNINKNDK